MFGPYQVAITLGFFLKKEQYISFYTLAIQQSTSHVRFAKVTDPAVTMGASGTQATVHAEGLRASQKSNSVRGRVGARVTCTVCPLK